MKISFKNLKELSLTISKNKTKKIEILGRNRSSNSKTDKLYFGIIEGQINSDEDALKIIYNDDPGKTSALNKLKERLTQKLINTSFFVDSNQPQFSTMQQAYYTCYKNYVSSKILSGRSARATSIELAIQTLRKAHQFEFTDIAADLSRRLRFHHGTITGNHREYLRYSRLFDEYSRILKLEVDAEKCYTDIVIHLLKGSPILTFDTVEDAIDRLRIIGTQLPNVESFTIRFNYHASLAIYYIYKNEVDAAKKEINEGQKYFLGNEQRKGHKNKIFILNLILIQCLIHQKDYFEAKRVINDTIPLTEKGSINWFATLELKLLISLRSEHYQEAYEVYLLVSQRREFRQLYPYLAESWKLYRAYLEFFLRTEKIQPPADPAKRLKRFRIGKFLNDVPAFSKDKRGMNISILIVQVLLFLADRQYDQVIDRMEAIEAYCYRYLKPTSHLYRSNCFLKMLLLLPKAKFQRERAHWRGRHLLQKLRIAPAEIAFQNSEIEIIPYEDLWQQILQLLDNDANTNNKEPLRRTNRHKGSVSL